MPVLRTKEISTPVVFYSLANSTPCYALDRLIACAWNSEVRAIWRWSWSEVCRKLIWHHWATSLDYMAGRSCVQLRSVTSLLLRCSLFCNIQIFMQTPIWINILVWNRKLLKYLAKVWRFGLRPQEQLLHALSRRNTASLSCKWSTCDVF